MSTPTPASAPAPSRGGRPRFRSRRGNHHNHPPRDGNDASNSGPSTASDSPLALRPASVAPPSQPEASTTPAASSSRSHSPRDHGHNHGYRGRGGRGGRGNLRLAAGVQTMSGGGRAFGGQLTQSLTSSGSLHPEATEFRPGQVVHSQM